MESYWIGKTSSHQIVSDVQVKHSNMVLGSWINEEARSVGITPADITDVPSVLRPGCHLPHSSTPGSINGLANVGFAMLNTITQVSACTVTFKHENQDLFVVLFYRFCSYKQLGRNQWPWQGFILVTNCVIVTEAVHVQKRYQLYSTCIINSLISHQSGLLYHLHAIVFRSYQQ